MEPRSLGDRSGAHRLRHNNCQTADLAGPGNASTPTEPTGRRLYLLQTKSPKRQTIRVPTSLCQAQGVLGSVLVFPLFSVQLCVLCVYVVVSCVKTLTAETQRTQGCIEESNRDTTECWVLVQANVLSSAFRLLSLRSKLLKLELQTETPGRPVSKQRFNQVPHANSHAAQHQYQQQGDKRHY